jgi:hypothetical protein
MKASLAGTHMTVTSMVVDIYNEVRTWHEVSPQSQICDNLRHLLGGQMAG